MIKVYFIFHRSCVILNYTLARNSVESVQQTLYKINAGPEIAQTIQMVIQHAVRGY